MLEALDRSARRCARSFRIALIAGMAIGGLAATAAAQQQQTQPNQAPPRTQVHGDWTAICQPRPDGSGENCVMGQTVSNTGETQGAEARPVMEVVIGRLQDRQGFGMRITVPLGITLPPGATIAIDQNSPKSFPFQRCVPTGCQIDVPLDQNFLIELQRGIRGTVNFRDFAGQPVTLPFSLQGFTAAFAQVSS